MSRVINPNAAGQDRGRLMKTVASTLRALLAHGAVDDTSRDMAAFIAAALQAIASGIETSVTAWEKRGYWLKADRFRLDWEWTGRIGAGLERALIEDDWGKIAAYCVQIGDKVKDIELPKSARGGEPWVGAWRKLRLGRNA